MSLETCRIKWLKGAVIDWEAYKAEEAISLLASHLLSSPSQSTDSR